MPTLDLWQTDGEGLYEAQRDVTEPWMRGLFHSKADGTYSIRTVAPIGYSIPMDGPIGDLVKQTEVSEMRPAHIHFCIEAPGYHRVVTHLFQRGCPYIETDVVYGVKAPLIVDFVEHPPGTAPNGDKIDTKFYTIAYDFVLQPTAQGGRGVRSYAAGSARQGTEAAWRRLPRRSRPQGRSSVMIHGLRIAVAAAAMSLVPSRRRLPRPHPPGRPSRSRPSFRSAPAARPMWCPARCSISSPWNLGSRS